MSFQRALAMGTCCLLLVSFLCSATVSANALPFTDPSSVVTFEVDTELGPLDSTSPTTEAETGAPISTTTSRDNNPVYNVWEYAYVHDVPVNSRVGASHSAPQDNRSNQCLWAIVSCCNAATNYERDNCFDSLGCPGAWFQNLCSQEFIDVANSQVTSIFSGGFGFQ